MLVTRYDTMVFMGYLLTDRMSPPSVWALGGGATNFFFVFLLFLLLFCVVFYFYFFIFCSYMEFDVPALGLVPAPCKARMESSLELDDTIGRYDDRASLI